MRPLGRARGGRAPGGGGHDEKEQTLDQLDVSRGGERDVKNFINSTRSRLQDLRTAVETAENTPTAQRREVHSSISDELDRVNKDIFARLGVTA